MKTLGKRLDKLHFLGTVEKFIEKVCQLKIKSLFLQQSRQDKYESYTAPNQHIVIYIYL